MKVIRSFGLVKTLTRVYRGRETSERTPKSINEERDTRVTYNGGGQDLVNSVI